MDTTTQQYLFLGLLAVFAYLLGSVNFAILVTRLFIKDDIRNYGSGNAGMTNVLRTVGKKAAVLTTLGDVFKGIIPVLIARVLFANSTVIPTETAAYLVAFCALFGHLFPIYFGFKGGKGLLTAAGAMFVLDPLAVTILLGIFLICVFITKMISFGAIVVGALFPLATFMVQTYIFHQHVPIERICFSIAIGVILLYMHRSNMKRILNGTERKVGEKVDRSKESNRGENQ